MAYMFEATLCKLPNEREVERCTDYQELDLIHNDKWYRKF